MLYQFCMMRWFLIFLLMPISLNFNPLCKFLNLTLTHMIIYAQEKEVHGARRLKSSHTNVELLKEKLLEEQGRRERAEQELSKLQEIEAKAHKLEVELASCTELLSNIPDVSSYADIPQKFADLQKCVYPIYL